MAYETFTVERAGQIVTVSFNRPDVLNPMNAQVLHELLAITYELQEDENSRIVILTGHGRAFSVGADMNSLSAGVKTKSEKRAKPTDTAKMRLSKIGWRIMEEWERLDQITIAAVNGFAVGGGLSLVMACDFRIAASGARMWLPEVRLGATYMWGSISRLINLVGMAKAKELVMTCDEVNAEEALEIGLVNQVVPPEELHDAVQAWAEKLLKKPPMALRRTKEFFNALDTNRSGDITFADAHLALACLSSADMREAVTALEEKRDPVYQNR